MKSSKLKFIFATFSGVAFGLFTQGVSAGTVFSNYPVIGHAKLPPNVLLMLSVEFPTAMGVYQQDTFSFNEIKTKTYNGYFDPYLCYSYKFTSTKNNGDDEGGFFYPTSKATSEHLCAENSGAYSGNLLNAVSMTTLDIFRKTLSGGNRARGFGTAQTNYTDGDTATETYLRRAMIQPDKNQYKNLLERQINAGSNANMRKIAPFDTSVIYFNNGRYNNFGHKFSLSVGTARNTPNTRTGGGRYIYNASVKVCGDDANLRETNCVRFSNGKYKPEGLMQEHKEQMRFGVFGYLNRVNQSDGGIMRSRLKLLSEETEVKSTTNKNYALGKEINEVTGQFYVNPDVKDASDSSVTNSGVINYLNKFGDDSGYKTYDVLGRLFYSGLRYYRGLGNPTIYTSVATTANKDNFPVITDWDDPLARDAAQGCNRNNIMIMIGDTNDHEGSGENRIPGHDRSPFTDDNINYYAYGQRVLAKEGGTGTTDAQAKGMALVGPAYYAHTNDIRPELPKYQSVKTITIDVVENADYKTNANAYYLAAKYGGFDKRSDDDKWPDNREQWTDDAAGTTSLPPFSKGRPRDFSIGNDASRLDAAIKSAFSSASRIPLSQSAVTTPSISGAPNIDEKKNISVISQYFTDTWSGNVVANKLSDAGRVWNLNSALNTQFAGNAWQNRKAYVQIGNQTKRFNKAALSNAPFGEINTVLKASGDASGAEGKRADFILGDRTNEGVLGSNKIFRQRAKDSILGTIISSPVVYLPNSKVEKLPVCATPSVSEKIDAFAFASNDGMLHVIDTKNQKELMAFIPSSMFEPAISNTNISKAVRYTQKNYDHEFINDGIPVTRNMCVNGERRSILVGSAGKGGHSVYAIDGTDLSNPSEANILWEFTNKNDSDLGLTVGEPVLAYDKDNRPIAIISSGYNTGTKTKTSIFVLRVDKLKTQSWTLNSNYYKIDVASVSDGLGPVEVVTDADNKLSVLYAGDTEGRLWKINASNDNIKTWSNSFGSEKPFFTAKTSTGIKQPITAKPAHEIIDDTSYVFFGTGKLFVPEDTKNAIQQSAYGLIDKGVAITDYSKLVVQKTTDASLNTLIGTTSNGGSLFDTTKNELTSDNVGWRFDLPEKLMVVNQAITHKGRVFIPVFLPTLTTGVISATSSCEMTGKSGFLNLFGSDGRMSTSPNVDTNGDGKIDGNDSAFGLLLFDGLQSTAWSLVQTDKGVEIWAVGPDGEKPVSYVVDPPAKVKPNVRRMSWVIIH